MFFILFLSLLGFLLFNFPLSMLINSGSIIFMLVLSFWVTFCKNIFLLLLLSISMSPR
jgi:hypothetical protein